MTATSEVESIRPPEPPGFIIWVRQNLFNNWFNSILSVILLAAIIFAINGIVRWVFFSADWTPIVRNPLLLLVGQYPRNQLWRLGIATALISSLLGSSWRVWGGVMRVFSLTYALFLIVGVIWPKQAVTLTTQMRVFLLANLGVMLAGYLIAGFKFIRPRHVLIAWTLSLFISLVLLRGLGGVAFLPRIPTNLWGGLVVTMILAVGGITLSFPIGVLLALGRRSSLPVVKAFSIAFIEVIRGVPLISILFLFSIILPLFLPPAIQIDRLIRALIGMTIFSAAYSAENVRGGLAAVPEGQIEAARAVGLNNFQITLLIQLPQALRLVIPPIVGQFISLFKDTTLAAGIAVLELLTIGRSILEGNPEYIGLQAEVYIFIAAVFWVFSYLMSYASQRLEVALGVGER